MNRVNLLKSRTVGVWMAVGLLCVSGASSLRADEGADCKALDALYQKSAAGIRKRDSRFTLSLETADFKHKTPDGHTQSRQESDREMQAGLADAQKIVLFQIKPVSCKITGHKVVVRINVKMVMQLADRQGKTRTFGFSEIDKDTWIKTSAGWRLQLTEDGVPTDATVDGHRISPPRPPVKPATK